MSRRTSLARVDKRSLGTKGREPLGTLVLSPQKRLLGWAVAVVRPHGWSLDTWGDCRGADQAGEGLRERWDRWGQEGVARSQRGPWGGSGLSPLDLGGAVLALGQGEVSEGRFSREGEGGPEAASGTKRHGAGTWPFSHGFLLLLVTTTQEATVRQMDVDNTSAQHSWEGQGGPDSSRAPVRKLVS